MREGALASFVGSADDLAAGDRCLVLSDEGAYSSVRWVTGARSGEYETVLNRDLVSDRKTKVSAWDDDEFGFEYEPPSSVRVASMEVHARGGDAGLFRALDSDGMVDALRPTVREAVEMMRDAALSDPGWREVVSELGDRGGAFMGFVLRTLVASAVMEEDSDGPSEEA